MRKLIADCGSTKCDWALVDNLNNLVVSEFKTEGLNLAISDRARIEQFVDQLPALEDVEGIFFYAAGATINRDNDQLLYLALTKRCGTDVCIIDSDLVGAAKALFGSSPGIACILGTGSNSGVYDGKKITINTPPLGYILGDEGSGAALGRRLVNAVFKHRLPMDIEEDFFEMYGIDKQKLIENVYRCSGANFYLAQFTKFLSANINREEIQQLVETEFRAFIENNLTPYGICDQLIGVPLGFVGSIAYHFAPQLRKVVGEFYSEMPKVSILPSPIDGLVLNALI